MARIAVVAAAFAFLVAADREGRAAGCGTPLVNAVSILLALATGYLIVRIATFGNRHAS
jgi:hypothetical protein